jgi:hypothetical protein
MRGVAAAAAVAVLAPACSSNERVKQAIEDASTAQAALKKEFGADVSVMYGFSTGTSGRRFDVQVRFAQTPEGDAAKVKERTAAIVKQSFHEPISSVTVLF